MLACFDIGGTSVKCGFWVNNEITRKEKFATPDNLDSMIASMKAYIADEVIEGVAISSPGIVHQDTGRVTGLSAVPYIHEIELVKILEEELDAKVSIENDANCAALAESKYGVAKGVDSSAFIVIGTGIGGAFILDNQIIKGQNLLAGEYGMLRDNNEPVGDFTLVHQAEKYSSKISGKELIRKAQAGDQEAKVLVDEFIEKMSTLIFNVEVLLDPAMFVIGGGVSHESEIILAIKKRANEFLHDRGYEEFEIKVEPCMYQNDANLIGAVVSYNN